MSNAFKESLDVQMNYSNNPERAAEKRECVEKAFQLGLVNPDGTLIDRVGAKV